MVRARRRRHDPHERGEAHRAWARPGRCSPQTSAGALATCQNAPVDWINVKTAYGAAGNGSTDDTTAIQNAINAGTAFAYGAVIYFPAGDYTVTSTLTCQTTVPVYFLGDHPHVLRHRGLPAGLRLVGLRQPYPEQRRRHRGSPYTA